MKAYFLPIAAITLSVLMLLSSFVIIPHIEITHNMNTFVSTYLSVFSFGLSIIFMFVAKHYVSES